MTSYILLAVYCIVIMLASLIGGWLPSRVKFTHTGAQVMMSFVAGLMLGVAFYHLIPHAVMVQSAEDAVDRTMWWAMVGLMLMFIMLRAFHFHQHGTTEEVAHSHDLPHGHHDHCDGHATGKASTASWVGIAIGLAIHTLIDGVALGAAVQLGMLEDELFGLVGIGVFVAILLHKPLDAMSITQLMIAGGWGARARLLVNLAFAAMCPLGAWLFIVGSGSLSSEQGAVLSATLAFSAGVFICISLSDLLPELQFHSHDRLKLTAALFAGVIAAFAIGLLEPEHQYHQTHQGTHPHSHGAAPLGQWGLPEK